MAAVERIEGDGFALTIVRSNDQDEPVVFITPKASAFGLGGPPRKVDDGS